VVHPSLEGSLTLVQCLVVPRKLSGVPTDHLLPALEGLPLPVEPVFEGVELLLLEAKLPLAFARFCFSNGEPSLLQA
jgi:hypothetical protein